MRIELTRGKFAIIDDDDYFWIKAWKWSCNDQGYARRIRKVKGKCHEVRMHRAIVAAPLGLDVDHIDGNRLNNRKSNLRLSTRSQNHFNRKPRQKTASGYKGVSWSKDRWMVRVVIGGRSKNIGKFNCKHDAAEAYNAAASREYGEFAKLNIIKR